MFTMSRITSLVAVGLVAAAIPAGVALAKGNPHHDGFTAHQNTLIRKATKQFRDVDAALAAGYLPTEECAELPGVGGMGYHFVKPVLTMDTVADPTMPETLLYNMTKDGRWRLDAVEYFVADADQDLTTDADRPSLLGHAFDGPMPGHGGGMPVHYDLHVWLYHHNPLGELSAWNPAVSCT